MTRYLVGGQSIEITFRSARFRFQRVHARHTPIFHRSITRSINLSIYSPGSRYFLRGSVDNLAQLRAILGLGSQPNMCVISDICAREMPIPRGVAAKTIILGEMEHDDVES